MIWSLLKVFIFIALIAALAYGAGLLLDTGGGIQITVAGAIIIGTLLDELERSGKSVGLATLCIASGMGAATIIERV